MASAPKHGARLTVSCPACRREALYAAENPWRPFCSERCRNVDLGAWANEAYRVSAAAPSDDDPEAAPPPLAH